MSMESEHNSLPIVCQSVGDRGPPEGLSVMSMSEPYICLHVLRQKNNITIDDYHKMNHCQEAVVETSINIPLL